MNSVVVLVLGFVVAFLGYGVYAKYIDEKIVKAFLGGHGPQHHRSRPLGFGRGRVPGGDLRVLVIEQNHSAQLYRYLRGEFDFGCELASLHKAGGAQYLPGELQRRILDWSRA